MIFGRGYLLTRVVPAPLMSLERTPREPSIGDENDHHGTAVQLADRLATGF